MRKNVKVLGVVVLCATLLAGCGTSTSSSSESYSDSTIVQNVASSNSSEVSNDSLEEFESLKDEAENLLEEGKYKEAVAAATKAYQLVGDKEGEEEFVLCVAEKLAKECGLENPQAEIDITYKNTTYNGIQVRSDNLSSKDKDEIVSIYKKMYREGLDTIMSGGREGGAKTPYIVTHLVSDGERYYVSEGELRIINDTAYTKTEGRKKWSTGGSNNGSSSSGSESNRKNDSIPTAGERSSDVIKNGNSKDSYGHDKFDAFVIAENAVKKKLKSPSTAQFCTTTEATIGRNGNTWTVKGWVDAQNGYGATVRANFVVTFTFASKDTYSVALCTVSYDCAIVTYIMICQKEICEISAPFPVDFVRCEILFKLILKYFMRFSVFISRLFWTHNRTEAQLRIHIFMYRCWTVKIAFTLQINFHTPVSVNSIVCVIDFLNLCLYFSFMGIVICLPVFPVVVVCVWTNFKPPKEPAQTKQPMILLNKPISL